MTPRLRHCVECPNCMTRYLVGFSPYSNGSYLLSMARGFPEEGILYCSCGRPPLASQWRWSELKIYAVANRAHDRGYGSPEEIVFVGRKLRRSN